MSKNKSVPFDIVETVDQRMLAFTRCILAWSALAIIVIDPSEPARLVELTYVSVSIYCIYSTVLTLESDWLSRMLPQRILHWIDICFYTYLVALTEGTSSIFFFFYFFSILVASFTRGYKEGQAVTLVSFISFTIVGLIFSPGGAAFELNRSLIRAIYLLVFGYIFAYLGGYERLLKRRLILLQEINNILNPRLGVNHAISTGLKLVLDFYNARSCMLVLQRPVTSPCFMMYQARADRHDRPTVPLDIGEKMADMLTRIPESLGVYYHDQKSIWRGIFTSVFVYDFTRKESVTAKDLREICANLANLLESHSFITVPYLQRDGSSGRLYLIPDQSVLKDSDVGYLMQVSNAMSTVIENICLLEEVIAGTTKHERDTIARDLHDSTIQPYIGLRLALEALRREAGYSNPLTRRITELLSMVDMTINDLRDYATSLKESKSLSTGFLFSVAKRHADRLKRFYGINVDVQGDASLILNDHIAGEALQIISEGLSNILRHTTAKNAFISIRIENASLVVELGNESQGRGGEKFIPRSINERVLSLGGKCLVEYNSDGYTIVKVSIPM